jgi:hypothetical protein
MGPAFGYILSPTTLNGGRLQFSVEMNFVGHFVLIITLRGFAYIRLSEIVSSYLTTLMVRVKLCFKIFQITDMISHCLFLCV